MEQQYWNATIDYKFVNKYNDEKLLLQLQIDDFKINEQINEQHFKLRLSRNEKLFSNETIYFINNYLNNENIDINCLFSGKNRRFSLILYGCTKFNGYLITTQNIYSITPSANTTNYRVQLINQQEILSKCSSKITTSSLKIGSSSQKSAQNHLNLNLNIQKSLIYGLNNDPAKLKALFQNLIENFHLTSSYFNGIYDINVNVSSISLIDLHTNKFLKLNDLKVNTSSSGLNIFLIDSHVNDDCFVEKANVCDLTSNKIFIKYDKNVLKMSNNFISTMMNLLSKDNCLHLNDDNLYLMDFTLNEHEIDKSCFVSCEHDKFNQKTSICGNGVVEAGEDCDCAGRTDCDFNCCDMKTCKFKQTDYECSQGSCCSQCKLRGAGSVCRSKVDTDCDVAERCDGSSAECPADVNVHDGVFCNSGVCYSGKCVNADNQCKRIWNEKSVSSDDSCYKNFNTIGFQNGNCASSSIDASNENIKYEACSNEDSLCGLINCQYGNDKPLISTESFFKSTTTIKDKQYECKIITNTNNSDLMYVNDGTLCNNNKICVNRKCINIPQLKCPTSNINKKICSGNGICNSELKCICNEKWTGSACDYYLSDTVENPISNQTIQNLKLDFKSTLNTTSLLSIIAGFILIFLFIFVFLFIFHRRRRARSASSTSIDKIENYNEPNNFNLNCNEIILINQDDFNTNGSIKFGSLPSYKEYKMKNKILTGNSQSIGQPTPSKISNNSMLSCGDSISLTKLNNAIKQLNNQPYKGILKNKPSDSQQEYYEEINALNDTYTNTNLNAKYSTYNTQRASLTLSTASSSDSSLSSNSSSTPTLVVPPHLEIENMNLEHEVNDCGNDMTPVFNDIFMNENQSFQIKVQDYLNELNLLSKQNNFANNEDPSLLITPVKPLFCENLNTINSEASSGYISASTSNQNNANSCTSAVGSGGLLKRVNSDSIIYDENESGNNSRQNDTTTTRLLNDKRYSYILATASINNLNMDPE